MPKERPRTGTYAGSWPPSDPVEWDQEQVEGVWFRVLAELFPGKQPDDLSGREWAVMRDEGPGAITPF